MPISSAKAVVLFMTKSHFHVAKCDKDREKIQELLLLGVPQTRIVKAHLEYSMPKSLSYYIRTRKLRKKAQKS